MRRNLTLLLIISLLTGLLCGSVAEGQEPNSHPEDYDAMITQALTVLQEGWAETYAEYGVPGMAYQVDIRSVRVIRLKDHLGELGENEAAFFGDIRYVIEFLMYDDYISSGIHSLGPGYNAGYLDYSGMGNAVTVDHEGRMTLVARSPFVLYRMKTYANDFSPIIEEIIDFHEQYNQVIEFPCSGSGD